MMGNYITSISGESVKEDKISEIANKVALLIMSELPKEAQTYDMALYVLRMAKEQIKGSKIVL